jgi:hypothetical protein
MASGDTLIIFTPQSNVAPTSAPATFDSRNDHLVLDFDAAAIEAAVFPAVLPRHYAGGGLTLTIVGSFTSDVTPGNAARLGASFERMDNNVLDVDADSFATEKTVDANPRASSGVLTYSTLAFSSAEIDGVLAGEAFRLKFRRVATDGADTAAGDYELHRIEIRET